MTLRFENPSAKPVWLWEECVPQIEIASCTSGFTTPLTIDAFCSGECGSPNSCIVCGPCFAGPIEVAPGKALDVLWSGATYTFATDAMGCSCHVTTPAPHGAYRVRAGVYDTMPAQSGVKPPADRTVEADFALPAPGGVVTIAASPLGGFGNGGGFGDGSDLGADAAR